MPKYYPITDTIEQKLENKITLVPAKDIVSGKCIIDQPSIKLSILAATASQGRSSLA